MHPPTRACTHSSYAPTHASNHASVCTSTHTSAYRQAWDSMTRQLATQVHLSAERGYTCSRAQP
jgi:hypothetical protein